MTEKCKTAKPTAPKKREEIRFEKEAKALQKNLEKRKQQQQAREELKEKA